LARRGETVDLKPRTVVVHTIELTAFAYPELGLRIECGSGTYIRSIGRDLGEQLGCGAVMSGLIRTRVGPFRLDEAVDLETLTNDSLSAVMRPPTMATAHLPQFSCSQEQESLVACGRSIGPVKVEGCVDGQLVAVVKDDSELACLARYDRTVQTLAPEQVFLQQPGNESRD
jgi:tRNA pseudouridine55 synthase